MSDSVTIDAGGTARLGASLDDAAQALADPSALLADLAAQVLTTATARAPRRTGALAGSGHAAAGQLEGNPAQVLTWGVRYALFVNFGTRYMRAQPFATDALAAAAADADTALADWAGAIINKVGA